MKKVLVAIALIALTATSSMADQLYDSTYKFDADGPLTAHSSANFNIITQSIDTRLNTQESAGGNIFATIAVSGEDSVVADTTSDTLTIVAGSNVTITNTAASDTIQIDVSTGTLVVLGGGVEVVAGATDLDFDADFAVSDEGSNEAGITLADDPTIAGFLSIGDRTRPLATGCL